MEQLHLLWISAENIIVTHEYWVIYKQNMQSTTYEIESGKNLSIIKQQIQEVTTSTAK